MEARRIEIMKKFVLVCLLVSLCACAKNKQAKTTQPATPEQAAQLDLKDANQLLAQKRCDQAIPHYLKFLEKYPSYSAAWNLLGLAYLCNSQPQEAVPSFQRALQVSPTFTDVHNNLGVAYMELKNYTEARNEFMKALQDTSYPVSGPYFNLAKLAFLQESYEESRALAKKVADANPRAPGPLLLYALSLEKLGRQAEAAETYRSVLKTIPDNLEACYHLANLLLQQNQGCAAKEYFRKIVDADPLGDLGQKSIQALKTVNCAN
jgi:Tfp pilus assembly protein PilF